MQPGHSDRGPCPQPPAGIRPELDNRADRLMPRSNGALMRGQVAFGHMQIGPAYGANLNSNQYLPRRRFGHWQLN